MQSSYTLVITTRETFQVLYTALANSSAALLHPCPLTSSDYQFSLIPALFSFFFLGLVGNTMVVVVLRCHSGPTTVANIYIFNLAMADLLCLATLPFWATYYAQGYNWLFGSVVQNIQFCLVLEAVCKYIFHYMHECGPLPCMAFANSCINPLLYCFIGNQFQEKLHHLFKRQVYQFNSHRESSSLRKGSCFRETETPAGRDGGPESLL